jgi:hypothetical protein
MLEGSVAGPILEPLDTLLGPSAAVAEELACLILGHASHDVGHCVVHEERRLGDLKLMLLGDAEVGLGHVRLFFRERFSDAPILELMGMKKRPKALVGSC